MLKRLLRHPLTCLLLALALTFVLTWALGRLPLPAGPGMGALLALSVPQALAATLALVLVGRLVERRDWGGLGLAPQGAGRQLLAGAGVGLLVMGAIVGVLALCGWYRVEGLGSVPHALALLAFFGMAAWFEEVLFRGLAFRLLEAWLGSAGALLLSSLFFGWAHILNPNASPVAALAISVEAGLLLGAAYMRTRALWFPTGLHVAWNFVQGGLFGVAVSGWHQPGLLRGQLEGPALWTGGDFGAEAGLVAVALATALGGWLLREAVRSGEWRPRTFLRPRAAPRQEGTG